MVSGHVIVKLLPKFLDPIVFRRVRREKMAHECARKTLERHFRTATRMNAVVVEDQVNLLGFGVRSSKLGEEPNEKSKRPERLVPGTGGGNVPYGTRSPTAERSSQGRAPRAIGDRLLKVACSMLRHGTFYAPPRASPVAGAPLDCVASPASILNGCSHPPAVEAGAAPCQRRPCALSLRPS